MNTFSTHCVRDGCGTSGGQRVGNSGERCELEVMFQIHEDIGRECLKSQKWTRPPQTRTEGPGQNSEHLVGEEPASSQ